MSIKALSEDTKKSVAGFFETNTNFTPTDAARLIIDLKKSGNVPDFIGAMSHSLKIDRFDVKRAIMALADIDQLILSGHL